MRGLWAWLGRAAMALLLVIAGSFLSSVAMGSAGADSLWPQFSTIIVFFVLSRWTDLIGAPMLFLAGLVQDLVIGNAFGAGLVGLVAGGLLLESWIERTRGAPMLHEWARFGPFVAVVIGIEWSLTAARALAAPPWEPFLWHLGVTFLAYGIFAAIAHGLSHLSNRGRSSEIY